MFVFFRNIVKTKKSLAKFNFFFNMNLIFIMLSSFAIAKYVLDEVSLFQLYFSIRRTKKIEYAKYFWVS